MSLMYALIWFELGMVTDNIEPYSLILLNDLDLDLRSKGPRKENLLPQLFQLVLLI